MRKRSRWVGLVVSLALVVVMTVGTISAQATIYRVGKYDIYYYNKIQYSWARGLARYVPEAWRAAYTVIGNKTLKGQIQVRFYSTKNNTPGYMSSGTQKIYLNRYKFSSYANWGGTLAYETSHVLFYNYTKAASWNSNLRHYRTWITESLARYTGHVAYRWGSRWSAATVKRNLKYNASRSAEWTVNRSAEWGFYRSAGWTFYMMGYYYSQNTAIYGQAATGYFLTGGRTYSTSANVARLMNSMRVYSSYSGSGLRSSCYSTALSRFEYTFKYATGYYANAGLIYGSINNKKYLMGKFYYQWYV